MGKLLIGHYGNMPEAESVELTLRECHQRLGLKPNDFVSAETPDFFTHKRGAKGRYLVFEVKSSEIDNVMWKPGYYLLPLEAADVLKVFQKGETSETARPKPVQVVSKGTPPSDVVARAQRWAEASQPLFFSCRCDALELQLDPPWGLRRRWKVRLRCSKRCQPALSDTI